MKLDYPVMLLGVPVATSLLLWVMNDEFIDEELPPQRDPSPLLHEAGRDCGRSQSLRRTP